MAKMKAAMAAVLRLSPAASVPGSSIAVVPSLVTVLSGAVAVIAFTIASDSRYPARPVVTGTAFLCVSVWGPVQPQPHRG